MVDDPGRGRQGPGGRSGRGSAVVADRAPILGVGGTGSPPDECHRPRRPHPARAGQLDRPDPSGEDQRGAGPPRGRQDADTDAESRGARRRGQRTGPSRACREGRPVLPADLRPTYQPSTNAEKTELKINSAYRAVTKRVRGGTRTITPPPVTLSGDLILAGQAGAGDERHRFYPTCRPDNPAVRSSRSPC